VIESGAHVRISTASSRLPVNTGIAGSLCRSPRHLGHRAEGGPALIVPGTGVGFDKK